MLRLKILKDEDILKIVEWNRNTAESFLYQWAGKKAYEYPITEGQIAARIIKGDVTIYRIENDREMVGTVEIGTLDERNKSVRFGRLLIGDDYRRRGYGSKAIELVEEKASNEYGVKYLELGVFEFNKEAKKLYEKLGYETTEITENENDAKWSSYTMVKKL